MNNWLCVQQCVFVSPAYY